VLEIMITEVGGEIPAVLSAEKFLGVVEPPVEQGDLCAGKQLVKNPPRQGAYDGRIFGVDRLKHGSGTLEGALVHLARRAAMTRWIKNLPNLRASPKQGKRSKR
jgi:hypothetical protein